MGKNHWLFGDQRKNPLDWVCSLGLMVLGSPLQIQEDTVPLWGRVGKDPLEDSSVWVPVVRSELSSGRGAVHCHGLLLSPFSLLFQWRQRDSIIPVLYFMPEIWYGQSLEFGRTWDIFWRLPPRDTHESGFGTLSSHSQACFLYCRHKRTLRLRNLYVLYPLFRCWLFFQFLGLLTSSSPPSSHTPFCNS